MMYKLNDGLEELIFLLIDLEVIQDFHIKGFKLVGLTIKGVRYGDMSY